MLHSFQRRIEMTAKSVIAIIPFVLATALQGAQAQPASAVQSASADLRPAIGKAHTPEQYRNAASYFRSRQKQYAVRAREEKSEWIRREERPTSGLAMKYPQPEMSSRYRYEYFAYEEARMAKTADRYDRLAVAASSSAHDETSHGGF
jgi:hypothetical protein